MEADLADVAMAWVVGSDTELRNIILMGDVIFRARHGALEEMETDSAFLLSAGTLICPGQHSCEWGLESVTGRQISIMKLPAEGGFQKLVEDEARRALG